MLVHFLGGLLIALIGVFIFRTVASRYEDATPSLLPTLSGERILLLTLSTAVLVGIGWEIFEYVAHLRNIHHYVIDTATDLIMDILGALFAYTFLVHSRFSRMLH